MEYISQEKILEYFTNLIEIQSIIYDLTLNNLVRLEIEGIKNPKEFDKVIKKVNLLRTKEQRVLDKIEDSDYYYSMLNIIEEKVKKYSKDDIQKARAIAARLNLIFQQKYESEIQAEEAINEFFENFDYDDEELENKEIKIVFETGEPLDYYTPFQVNFLKQIDEQNVNSEEFIKYKYYTSFTHPFLEKQLSLAKYNQHNIENMKDDIIMELYDVEEREHQENIKQTRFNYAENSLADLFTLACDEDITKETIKIAYEQAKFALKDQDTKSLLYFYLMYFNYEEEYILTECSLKYIEALISELSNELIKREDFSEDMLDIPLEDLQMEIEKIVYNPDFAEVFFNIIENAKLIYKEFTKLYLLELNHQKHTEEYQERLKHLKILTDKEKEYSSQIEVEAEEKAELSKIIKKYFYNLQKLKNNFTESDSLGYYMLRKRIEDILFDTKIKNDSLYKDINIPHYIIKNYELECLSKFEQTYSSQNSAYLGCKYNQIISDPSLTEEFIYAGGSLTNSIILDDETMSTLLGVEIDEYLFDKETILSSHASNIIEVFSGIPEDYEPTGLEKANIDYQTIALETALKYSDKEVIDDIQNKLPDLNQIDKSILHIKLNQIFNKKEKQLTKKRQ